MKYNILTFCNHQYAQFAYAFVRSLISNCEMHKINEIIIIDTGLLDIERDILLSISGQIRFIKSDASYEGAVHTHSAEWIDIVKVKTRMLRRCVASNKLPIIMMDIDHIVVKDFLPLDGANCMMTVCSRKQPAMRSDGMRLDYISSFLAVHEKKALYFIDEWIDRADRRIALNLIPGYETPALCDALSAASLGKDFNTVLDAEYSSPNNYDPALTKIIHLKSEGPYNGTDLYGFRLSQVCGIDASVLNGLIYPPATNSPA